jgi:hypothetical protein
VKDEKNALKYNSPYWYVDRKNNIISQHYPDIKNNNKEFKKRMTRRFEKIEKVLLKAKKICFISCRNEDVMVFYHFLHIFGEMYPANITYINIRNKNDSLSPSVSSFSNIKYIKEKLSEKLELIEYEFIDVHPNGNDLKTNRDAWIGNYVIWDKIMERIAVKNKMNFFTYLFKGLVRDK